MPTCLPLLAVLAFQSTEIGRFTQPDLHDLTFNGKVLHANQEELRKINKDFGQSYRFESTSVRAKEPFMLRIDAKVEDTTIRYVINGGEELIRTGGLKIRQDLSKSPGKRQTTFDFGILTPSLFEELYQAKFVRTDRTSGDAVFDITYLAKFNDTSRSRIWVSHSTKTIEKREWYNQQGRQLATFLYKNPVQVNGIWAPTRVEVKNVDNVTAAITTYDGLKVNTGLDGAVFAVR